MKWPIQLIPSEYPQRVMDATLKAQWLPIKMMSFTITALLVMGTPKKANIPPRKRNRRKQSR